MSRSVSNPLGLFLSGLLIGASAAGVALADTTRGAFVLQTATDTVAVERFERTSTTLRGELLFRIGDQRWTYALDLDPADGHVTRMETQFRRATAGVDAPPLQSGTLVFVGDSVLATTGTHATERLATRRGATPFVNPSFVLQEHMARLALAQGPDTRVGAFAVSGGSTFEVHVTRLGADSVVLEVGGIAMRMHMNAAGDFIGGGVPSQGLTLTRVAALDPRLFTPSAPDYSAPLGAPYSAIEVAIPTRGGFTLAGTLTLPLAGNGRAPCAITISGSGPQDRDQQLQGVKGYQIFRQVADALSRRGIAVLRLDDRGTGASGGSFRGSSSLEFARDVEDALAWLRQDSRVDPAKLALIGLSEGGLIAPLVAEKDAGLRAMVLMAAPAWPGRRILEYQYGAIVDRGRPATPALRDSLLRQTMSEVDSVARVDPWMRFFVTHDPLKTAARVRVPVLVLQGETDRQVTAEQADQLATAMRGGGNKAVTVRRFPGLDHLFLNDATGDPLGYSKLADTAVPQDVLRAIGEWLQSRLR